jgi:arylsulfatase A-like enzyme
MISARRFCSIAVLLVGCATPHVSEDSATPGSDPDPAACWNTEGAKTTLSFKGAVPTNVLIVSLDTLRTNSVGAYGSREPTPTLDNLLAESVRLSDFRACSNWTVSGMLCALSGVPPFQLGFEPYSGDERVPGLPVRVSGLADWYRALGYTTQLVSSNPLLRATTPPGTSYQYVMTAPWARADWVRRTGLEAASTLKSQEPWLLHLHFSDPHHPYEPPAPWLEGIEELPPLAVDVNDPAQMQEFENNWPHISEERQALVLAHLEFRYRAEVAYMDQELGHLFDGLEDAGALDDTLVVIFSDHGEQFFEHEKLQHSQGLFNEENQAIAAFWAKNLEPGTWDGPTHQVDIPATLAELHHLAPHHDLSGCPVGSGLADRTRFAFRYEVKKNGQGMPHLALERAGDRLVYSWSGSTWFFNEETDPEEKHNLFPQTDAEDDVLLEDLWQQVLQLNADLFPHLAPATPRAAGND